MTGRRRFLANGAAVTAVTVAALAQPPNVIAQPKVQWRLSTAYPPVLDQLHGLRCMVREVLRTNPGQQQEDSRS